MKTIQFNANNILNGNNYPIAYYYPIAKDLVVISTGHDDSIIDDSMGYSEYIIPILEAIQSTSLKVYTGYILLRLLLRLPIIKVHIPGYSLLALLTRMPISNISKLPYTMYSAKTMTNANLLSITLTIHLS